MDEKALINSHIVTNERYQGVKAICYLDSCTLFM